MSKDPFTIPRRIEDHPNYAITPNGTIVNIKTKRLLNPGIDERGYVRVKMDGKRILVSRLVAKTFLPNPENKPNVRYRDGDKSNVRVTNLQWATNSEIQRPDKCK